LALMADGRSIITSFEQKFAEIRAESERAIVQLDDSEIRKSLDAEERSGKRLQQKSIRSLSSAKA